MITSKEEAQEKLGNRRGVLGLDPYTKGTFLRAEQDENDIVVKTIKVVEFILTMDDPKEKLLSWDCQLGSIKSNVIMLSTELWDRIFADPDIGPTLNGYAKMPEEFYHKNWQEFECVPTKDPFDIANPL